MVSGADKVAMPMGGEPLTPQQIGLLKASIEQGATRPGPAASVAAAAPVTSPGAATSSHWAFQPVVRPAVPSTELRMGERARLTTSCSPGSKRKT